MRKLKDQRMLCAIGWVLVILQTKACHGAIIGGQCEKDSDCTVPNSECGTSCKCLSSYFPNDIGECMLVSKLKPNITMTYVNQKEIKLTWIKPPNTESYTVDITIMPGATLEKGARSPKSFSNLDSSIEYKFTAVGKYKNFSSLATVVTGLAYNITTGTYVKIYTKEPRGYTYVYIDKWGSLNVHHPKFLNKYNTRLYGSRIQIFPVKGETDLYWFYGSGPKKWIGETYSTTSAKRNLFPGHTWRLNWVQAFFTKENVRTQFRFIPETSTYEGYTILCCEKDRGCSQYLTLMYWVNHGFRYPLRYLTCSNSLQPTIWFFA